ncbi:MAG: metal-dependent transcriptional regulator [Ruminococcus sp.]|nr:metal-dependent transcriptional regulator [Ruminococcus sp.]
MKIQKSAEDYLEAILILHNQNGNVHAVDIANKLGFSKPSVSVAMKKLRENDCIVVDNTNAITLTEQGKAIAEKIYDRHLLLSNWLEFIGVSPETASEDACKMEHVFSEESFAAMKRYMQKIQFTEKETTSDSEKEE